MSNLLRIVRLAGLSLIILIWALLPIPAQAFESDYIGVTIPVNTSEDQFNTDDSHCSLREAIYTANNYEPMAGCPTGSITTDIITLPAGTYTLTIEGSEDNDIAGDLDIATHPVESPPRAPNGLSTYYDLVIQGAGASSTIITSGWTEFDDRILEVSSISSAYLSNLTITGGHTPEATGGGGILNRGTLYLYQVIVENNHTGVAVSYKQSGGPGGGIYNSVGATLTVQMSTIRSNTTGNSLLADDTNAGGGGGLYNVGTATIIQSTINNNQTGDAISSNGYGGYGGGISNFMTLTLINSTIYANQTGDAAGSGTGGFGGGIYAYGELTMESVTIAANVTGSAPFNAGDTHGGGLYSTHPEANHSIHNTLISTNAAPDGLGEDCYTTAGKVLTADYSLIHDPDYCTLAGDHNLLDENAYLQGLDHYGGPTLTVAISWNSHATDAGDPLDCPFSDQRGYTRPVDGLNSGVPLPDIGAYEYNGQPHDLFYLPLIIKPALIVLQPF